MAAQNLEELLYTRTFCKGDVRRMQVVMLEVEAELRSTGKNFVITRIFCNNTTRIRKTIFLHADPRSGNDIKEVTVEFKPLRSEYDIEVVYYDPAEVEEFSALIT